MKEILNQYKKFGEAEKFRSHIGKWLIQDRCQKGVGGFLKILRNCQSGSWQMLTSNYKVGGWAEKRPKTCLRNI